MFKAQFMLKNIRKFNFYLYFFLKSKVHRIILIGKMQKKSIQKVPLRI